MRSLPKLLASAGDRASRLAAGLLFLLVFSLSQAVLAAPPPVRIAVVPGGGSGMEQEVVDQLSNRLQDNENVALSTVNPDWYVVCNITQDLSQASGQIRYNGTVTVKTVGGQVISTTAVQKYNQDFSLTPGAPLNKKLVDNAVRDVVQGLVARATEPIQQAVQVEMETRDRLIRASVLGDQGKFDEAIAMIEPITPDTPHFNQARQLRERLIRQKVQQQKRRHGSSHR